MTKLEGQLKERYTEQFPSNIHTGMHRVRLKVGNQEFVIEEPMYAEEANWLRDQLAFALSEIIKKEAGDE